MVPVDTCACKIIGLARVNPRNQIRTIRARLPAGKDHLPRLRTMAISSLPKPIRRRKCQTGRKCKFANSSSQLELFDRFCLISIHSAIEVERGIATTCDAAGRRGFRGLYAGGKSLEYLTLSHPSAGQAARGGDTGEDPRPDWQTRGAYRSRPHPGESFKKNSE